MVKFEFLARFLVDHLTDPVMSRIIIIIIIIIIIRCEFSTQESGKL